MIDDDDEYCDRRPLRREVVVERERERGYIAGRRRGRRIARRVDDDDSLVSAERDAFAFAGFGLGGGGASLVIIGIILMCMAYFGMGFYDAAPAGYSAFDAGAAAGGGYTPELPPAGASSFYEGGGDLLAQRPMMFMGGGVLFLAGWMLVITSRLRSFLSDPL